MTNEEAPQPSSPAEISPDAAGQAAVGFSGDNIPDQPPATALSPDNLGGVALGTAPSAQETTDAKQTVDHELEPLSRDQSQHAETLLTQGKEHLGREAEMKQRYKQKRELEDQLKHVVDVVYGAEDVILENSGRMSVEATEELSDARAKYITLVDTALNTVRAEISEIANAAYRSKEKAVTLRKDAEDHYAANQPAYYDSALKNMTDAGVPFGNQPVVEPQPSPPAES